MIANDRGDGGKLLCVWWYIVPHFFAVVDKVDGLGNWKQVAQYVVSRVPGAHYQHSLANVRLTGAVGMTVCHATREFIKTRDGGYERL